MTSQLDVLRRLITQSVSIHPGDKARISNIIRQFVGILDNILENSSDDDLTQIGEVLHELRLNQYYIYNEVMRRLKNSIKAQDAVQKFRWRQLSRRLRRA